MIFGEFDVGGAEGLMLAHSVKMPDGTLPKGHVVDAADVERLKKLGNREDYCGTPGGRRSRRGRSGGTAE